MNELVDIIPTILRRREIVLQILVHASILNGNMEWE
jgi:hypothetical protein